MKASGTMTELKDGAFTNTWTEQNTKDNGRPTSSMEKERNSGKTTQSIRVTTSTA